MNTHVEGVELGEERLWPFWAKAEHLSIPVFIHPSGFKHPRFQKHQMWNGVGQPIEEAIAMSSLIYEGVLDRFPKLKLGIAHGGGFLPYYAGRFRQGCEALGRSEAGDPRGERRQTARHYSLMRLVRAVP